MTDLVTGATGFLGGALVHELVRRGSRPRVLVRPTRSVQTFENVTVDVILGSLEDLDSLRAAVRGATRIFHCAALSTDWGRWSDYRSSNVNGVRTLLEAARSEPGLERFVHVSTTDVYGYPERPCAEDCRPVDIGLPYNRSKCLGELIVRHYEAKHGLPVTILRPASIYGPGDRNFVLEYATRLRRRQAVLIGGGRTSAGLLYVDNAVDAMLAAADAPSTLGGAYNLRDSEDLTWRDFVNALADGLGLRRPWLSIPPRVAFWAGGAMEMLARGSGLGRRPLLTRHAVLLLSRDQAYPIDRAQRDFGFRSKIDVRAGIERSVTWLKRQDALGAHARANAKRAPAS